MSEKPISAKIRYPTGFSDTPYRDGEVIVISFVYGKHQDIGGYGKLGEGTLAVCQVDDKLVSVPISWITIPKPT